MAFLNMIFASSLEGHGYDNPNLDLDVDQSTWQKNKIDYMRIKKLGYCDCSVWISTCELVTDGGDVHAAEASRKSKIIMSNTTSST